MSGSQAALKTLYTQIEEIVLHFKEIRGEAAGIVRSSQMPDASLHLNDVLQATEEATITILDAAASIAALADDPSVKPAIKEKLNEQVGRIFEASSFQDISGQRIKKVLAQLSALEMQLQHLSDTARGGEHSVPKDSYLNGPALAAEAPSQDEIDKLFGSS